MKYGLIAAVVTAAFVGNAALAETYICTLKAEGRDTGWISKTIGVAIDDKTGVVLVSDALILGAYKKPIAASLLVNTAKRLSVKWEVSGEKDVRNVSYTRFMFKLTIFKGMGNKAIVKARPAGYYRTLGANGKCKLRK